MLRMKKRSLILAIVLIAALAVILPGCGKEEQSLEGLYIATFDLKGGTLETPTSSVGTKINFAYHPGTVVLDPCELNGYKLFRTGYVFTGWYTDESCTESSKWDFDSYINSEKLTLYAGWKVAIKHTYTVYYFDEDNTQIKLGEYEVEPGDKFDDWRRLAKNGRIGYTPLGFFSDPECTVAWDTSFTHPGEENVDLEVPVYVSYLKGNWTFVDSLATFERAISDNASIQLTADIDCAGAVLSFGDYGGKIAGNGHTISNFRVEKSKRGTTYLCSIFNNLLNEAEIFDVSFTGVTYDLSGTQNATELKVAALAVSCQGKGTIEVTISNVTIQGNIVTDYTGEITKANEFVYDIAGNAEVTVGDGCSVNVTINN